MAVESPAPEGDSSRRAAARRVWGVMTIDPPPIGETTVIEMCQDIVTLGRAPKSTYRVEDPTISHVHATFEAVRKPGERASYYVCDSSSNGTFINERRLAKNERHRLYGGEQIRCVPLRRVVSVYCVCAPPCLSVQCVRACARICVFYCARVSHAHVLFVHVFACVRVVLRGAIFVLLRVQSRMLVRVCVFCVCTYVCGRRMHLGD
jgi:hypothetical protein